ncbi:MAG: sugar transferase [Bacteroidota bacterium]
MSLFTTYYENVPIFFSATREEEFNVNRLLNNTNLSRFFENKKINIFINSKRINDIRYINKHLTEINQQISVGEYYFGHFETFTAKRNRMWINKIPLLGTLYFFFDFIINRILPKIKYLNILYFAISKGRNRLLSKAEVLGRLIAHGFEIDIFQNINGICYFRAKKINEITIKPKSSYGLIFKMKRIGKNGKTFDVYKFRTMHPYSEYLQNYIVQKHGLNEKGKIHRDFRLTPWGKWMRKYWIDEIPQLLNLFKGQMKLVGVRPVSENYYKRLPEDLQKLRIKYKPGCIPPYVALNFKSSFEAVVNAERVYLKLKSKNPYFTDLKFFFYALINIFLKGKRSS